MSLDLSVQNMTFSQLHKPMIADIRLNLVPFLLGDAGIGKSSHIQALAKELDTKVFSLAVNQLADRSDLTGLRPAEEEFIDANGQKVTHFTQRSFPHATIADCIMYAIQNPDKLAILFLDEINRAGSGLSSAVLSFITDRRIGTTAFPKNVRFIVAGNDRGNISNLDEASKTRFSIYHTTPDLDTFLAVNPNLNPFIRKTLMQDGNILVCRPITAAIDNDEDDGDHTETEVVLEDLLSDDNNFNQLTVPRTITYLSDWLNHMRSEDLKEMVNLGTLAPCITAKIGNTKFANLLLQNIITDMTAMPAQSVTIVKPARYEEMMDKNSVQDLNDFIMTLSDLEKSGLLVYCLYSRDNVKEQLRVLAPSIGALEKNDAKTLVTMASSGQLDESNVRCFLDDGSQIASIYSAMLEINLD